MSSFHKSVSKSAVSNRMSQAASFSEWDRPSSSMETAALPERRKRAVEEYETDEDIPLSKIRVVKSSRKKKDKEPEGSGNKEQFETW